MNIIGNKKAKFILMNLFWMAIIAFLSYRMPPYVDDYIHRTSFKDGSTINSISQIIPSVHTYYMTWGGRAVSMFFIQLMLMLPKWVFVLCNAVIYALVANVIYQYVKIGTEYIGRKRDSSGIGSESDNAELLVISAVYLFLWFFMPDFAEVVTWITGTVTYLWTNLAILVFGLLYYRDYCLGEESRDLIAGSDKRGLNLVITGIMYVILGFLAGQSNEAGACTVMVALFLFACAMIKDKRKIRFYHVLGAVSAAAGAALLILAPGNSIRVQASESAGASFLMKYIFRIGREGFYSVMFLAVPVTIGIGVMLIAARKRSIELLFYVLAFISIFVMTFSAGFANRVFQLPLLLISIGFATSLQVILSRLSAKHNDDTAGVILNIRRSIAVVCAILSLIALFEVVAGTLYSAGKDSFFDRQMIYYHIYDTEGALSGNGM